MQVTHYIHALKIPFKIPIAPEKAIERVVYSYLIFNEKITLIDSGVAGAKAAIFDCIKKNGRSPQEVAWLILSHSHPDHLGSAKTIKEATGCSVLAHPGEKRWIEDTDLQLKERPVPGFHTLVKGPVTIDGLLSDSETLEIGNEISLEVIHTPGHSAGSISLYCKAEKTIFTGDAIPLPNDLPIYENIVDCVSSIKKLMKYKDTEILLSSWEEPIQGHEKIEQRMADGILWLRKIHETVLQARINGIQDLMELCGYVVRELGLPPSAANPLVAKSFASSLEVQKDQILF